MQREKVFITVKTYPTPSTTYTELACTAGFREDGSWIRLYPIPFRFLEDEQRYGRYQWVEVGIERRYDQDQRPESYRVCDIDNIKPLDRVGIWNAWEERKNIIFKKERPYTNLGEIIALARKNELSLAIFKPSKIIDLIIKPAPPELPEKQLDNQLKQMDLLSQDHNLDDFKFMPKLPYTFSYRFEDDSGNKSTLMITDWEIGQLYLNCCKKDSPEEAARKVKKKYLNKFTEDKELYFFLGTTYKWHRRAKNPYIIIGVFYPPYTRQKYLLAPLLPHC